MRVELTRSGSGDLGRVGANLSGYQMDQPMLLNTDTQPYWSMVGGSFSTTTSPYVNRWESTAAPSDRWTVVESVGVSAVFAALSGNHMYDLRLRVLDASGNQVTELGHTLSGNTYGLSTSFERCEIRIPPGGRVQVELTRAGSGTGRIAVSLSGYQCQDAY